MNEKVVAFYSAYYFEHIQRIEQASRLLENSMQPLKQAGEGEYKKG